MAKKKTENGQEFSSSAYLVVPDPDKPSTWKLRVEDSPGKVTVAQMGRAAAALGKGFRGNKVQLSQADRAKALRKLRGLYNSHKAEPPAVLQQALFTTGIEDLMGLTTALTGLVADQPGLKDQLAEALAGLQEGVYLSTLSAMLNGDISYETVCKALQAALMAQHHAEEQGEGEMDSMGPMPSCPYHVLATGPDSFVYTDEDESKTYQQGYHMDGTNAVLEGEPIEVVMVPAPVPSMQQESVDLVEAAPGGTIKHANINRALNVIEGTTLIGPHSSNGTNRKRRYSDGALKKIASMAEGLPGYLNHVKPEDAFKPRDVRDLAVRHRNVRFDAATQTVKSDMYVLPEHASLVFGLAEQFGDHIGNSLVSRGLIQMEGDTEVVTDIVQVRSADLVTDPASTKGLFESQGAGDRTVTLTDLIESLKSTPTRKDTTMDFAAILQHLKEHPDTQKLLLEHLQVVPKAEHAAAVAERDAKIRSLEEGQQTLTSKVTTLEAEAKTAATSLQEAKVKIGEYEAKDALAAKRLALQEAITKHKLTTEFGSIKGAVSEDFKTLLEGMEESAWAKQLDDRYTALKGVPQGQQPKSRVKDEQPLQEGQQESKPLAGAHAKLMAAAGR
ncbi:MAG TPA: hypothetical protein VLA89_13090 [Gemmatimonadales bacterium]|nr:hypothetical protein [Gemmatimonadales bacterium]